MKIVIAKILTFLPITIMLGTSLGAVVVGFPMLFDKRVFEEPHFIEMISIHFVFVAIFILGLILYFKKKWQFVYPIAIGSAMWGIYTIVSYVARFGESLFSVIMIVQFFEAFTAIVPSIYLSARIKNEPIITKKSNEKIA